MKSSGKRSAIALYLLTQGNRLDAVERGEIPVEQHLLSTYYVDVMFDWARWDAGFWGFRHGLLNGLLNRQQTLAPEFARVKQMRSQIATGGMLPA